jgi:hypothetical protein
VATAAVAATVVSAVAKARAAVAHDVTEVAHGVTTIVAAVEAIVRAAHRAPIVPAAHRVETVPVAHRAPIVPEDRVPVVIVPRGTVISGEVAIVPSAMTAGAEATGGTIADTRGRP